MTVLIIESLLIVILKPLFVNLWFESKTDKNMAALTSELISSVYAPQFFQDLSKDVTQRNIQGTTCSDLLGAWSNLLFVWDNYACCLRVAVESECSRLQEKSKDSTKSPKKTNVQVRGREAPCLLLVIVDIHAYCFRHQSYLE